MSSIKKSESESFKKLPYPVLLNFEKGENMLACIGINPSTAKPNELDNTLKSVKRIAEFSGFDGWILYNVYPQRATDPKGFT